MRQLEGRGERRREVRLERRRGEEVTTVRCREMEAGQG